MFDELAKYKTNHFFLEPRGDLIKACNAPGNKCGVFLVYALANNRIELVYIGSSAQKSTSKENRTAADYVSLKDEITNAKHFNEVERSISWPLQIRFEKMEAIDVYWYVTYDANNHNFPEDVERVLLQKHKDINGRLPRWNRTKAR